MAVSHFEFQHGFRNVAARRFNGERTCGEEEPENQRFMEPFATDRRIFSSFVTSSPSFWTNLSPLCEGDDRIVPYTIYRRDAALSSFFGGRMTPILFDSECHLDDRHPRILL